MSKTILDPSVLLIVELDVGETDKTGGHVESYIYTEGTQVEPYDYVSIIQYLVGRISKLGRIPYNEVLEDLKQPED